MVCDSVNSTVKQVLFDEWSFLSYWITVSVNVKSISRGLVGIITSGEYGVGSRKEEVERRDYGIPQ